MKKLLIPLTLLAFVALAEPYKWMPRPEIVGVNITNGLTNTVPFILINPTWVKLAPNEKLVIEISPDGSFEIRTNESAVWNRRLPISKTNIPPFSYPKDGEAFAGTDGSYPQFKEWREWYFGFYLPEVYVPNHKPTEWETNFNCPGWVLSSSPMIQKGWRVVTNIQSDGVPEYLNIPTQVTNELKYR